MKWWVMVRVRGVKKQPGFPFGNLNMIFAPPSRVGVLRGICANDVHPRPSILPGNIWVDERVGEEWNYGNWKWDPRWK